ncbi:hypothetical protein CUJ89_26980 [Burkholderia pyrrocinia]|uniref:Cytochrome c domain-containing protein n=1 Tax=Burkholderia pyrrocinia TaxID=60550 RepID=A0A2Z5N520_BURPY|nr:hypothetical protein CUJ89_26980 [Burkholderia pyrrocinia]
MSSRGQQLFTSRHGRDRNCATCHGSTPTGAGRHVVTGKTIEPLALTFNSARLTDEARTETTGWQRRFRGRKAGHACSPDPCPYPCLAPDACPSWGEHPAT